MPERAEAIHLRNPRPVGRLAKLVSEKIASVGANRVAGAKLDAAAAYRAARGGKAGRNVLGWRLDQADRAALLERFPPAYSHTDADHVTLAAKVGTGIPLPCETEAMIVGRADDGEGVEAMVVRLGGTTDRPDGSTYHITWSLDRARGRRPVESNDVIRKCGWQPLSEPIAIRLQPVLWSPR